MNLRQDFKAALRAAYQGRREEGQTVSRALHDSVDEVWTALLKPLVVIDPEDREQVERFREIASCWADQVSYSDMREPGDMDHTEAMQAALREFANPTPPIEEPTGLGGVVEDERGTRWVRVNARHQNQWRPADVGDPKFYAFSQIRVTRVLSAGVPAEGGAE